MSRNMYVSAFWSELAMDPFRDLDEIDADAHEAVRRYLDRPHDYAPNRILTPDNPATKATKEG